MASTVLADSSILYLSFHRILSACAMSTDDSQVSVTLFPSFFFNIFKNLNIFKKYEKEGSELQRDHEKSEK